MAFDHDNKPIRLQGLPHSAIQISNKKRVSSTFKKSKRGLLMQLQLLGMDLNSTKVHSSEMHQNQQQREG